MFKHKLNSVYPSMIVGECSSATMRQRVVRNLDMFRKQLIDSVRLGFGFSPDTEGTLRKFMVLCKWTAAHVFATMWTLEPTVSTMLITGNMVDISASKID